MSDWWPFHYQEVNGYKKPVKYEPDSPLPEHQDLTGWSDNNFQNWLYHSEQWDDQDFEMFAAIYNLPFAKDYIDYLYDKRSGEEYLRNHGITKVHDPRRLPGATTSLAAIGYGGLNYVSKNVERLYR